MNVVVYLPALNGAKTIATVLDSIPASLPGVDRVNKIVIDDYSQDNTAIIAVRHGAKVMRHPHNLGTGKAFVSALPGGAVSEATRRCPPTVRTRRMFSMASSEALIASKGSAGH